MTSMLNDYINRRMTLQQTSMNSSLQTRAFSSLPPNRCLPEQINVMPAVRPQDEFRTYAKALPADKPARLVRESDYSFGLLNGLKNDATILGNFFKAINGKGTDHSVGTINDLAVKLGGLGIATIIATSKGSPFRKGMEFVGLGAWLASMHIWPKYFINKPIEMLKGVNLSQEYIDSYGRRKNFYQDAQYICWDLMTDKEIYAIGDKLGVPKNIPNRKKLIKKKAKQVSIQGNTLMLATAGLATPLMSALACNRIEKNIYLPLLDKNNAKNEKNSLVALRNYIRTLNNENTISQAFKASDIQEISEIMQECKNSTLSGKQVQSLRNIISKKVKGTPLEDAVSKNLNEIFSSQSIQGQKPALQLTEDIATQVTNIVKKYSDDGIIPNDLKNSLSELFKDENGMFKNLTGKKCDNMPAKIVEMFSLDKNGIATTEKVMNELSTVINSNRNYVFKNPDAVQKTLTEISQLTDINTKGIGEYFRKLAKLKFVGETSDSARVWQKSSEAFIDALGLGGDELKELANTPAASLRRNELINAAIDNVLKDEQKYEHAIKVLTKNAKTAVPLNERATKGMLSYLTNLENVLNKKYAQSDCVDKTLSQIKAVINYYKRELIANNSSATNAIFSPIRILGVLKEKSDLLPDDAKVLRKVLIEGQSADVFINQLDNFKEYLKNVGHKRLVINDLFAKLPDNVKTIMENLYPNNAKKMAEIADGNSAAIKLLLSKLSDGVNQQLQESDLLSEAEKTAAKGSLLTKYASVFSANGKSFPIGTSKATGQTFGEFLQNSAQKMFVNKRWLKITGFSLVGLVAASWIAILFMGRFNRYNENPFAPKKLDKEVK